MKILVTGGLGFIGSHVVSLLGDYEKIFIIDDLSNSYQEVFEALQQLVSAQKLEFCRGDLRDFQFVKSVVAQVDCVIHFAALKAISQSGKIPLEYYDTNVSGTLVLLRAMKAQSKNKLIYSSSACVYGNSKPVYTQQDSYDPVSVYGHTKMFCQIIIKDYIKINPAFEVISLRYFNPVGAHPSYLIGERPVVPNNLFPYIQRVVSGEQAALQVFGNDYQTRDGTCQRDYIHVLDLAQGHIDAISALKPGFNPINLGSGRGYTVLEVVQAYSQAVGKPIPYEFTGRRVPDPDILLADPSKAGEVLNWRATRSLEQMCADSWSFISKKIN